MPLTGIIAGAPSIASIGSVAAGVAAGAGVAVAAGAGAIIAAAVGGVAAGAACGAAWPAPASISPAASIADLSPIKRIVSHHLS